MHAGPGAYSHLLKMEKPSELCSRKGFGPLVSKAQRFKGRTYYTGPGPGTYKAGREAVNASLSISQAPASAAFMPKVGMRGEGGGGVRVRLGSCSIISAADSGTHATQAGK